MSFFIKRNCRCLKRRFKLLILIIILGLIYLGFTRIYSILSPDEVIKSDFMVVEGWMSDYAIEESLHIFRNDNYHHLFVTGGPLNNGYYLNNYKSDAEVATETLLLLGASKDSITMVIRELVWRDRTYHAALKLRSYLEENHPEVKSFNLISQGAHSARSWLLFKMAMPDFEIGIISIDNKLFDNNKWWKTSKGFRTVFTEAFGYFYIRFFFDPY